MVGQYLAAERIALDVEDVLPPHPLRGEVEASDTGEEGAVGHAPNNNLYMQICKSKFAFFPHNLFRPPLPCQPSPKEV